MSESLWDQKRVDRYIRLYGDPREQKGSQSQLCKDASSLILGPTVADFGCGMGHLIPFIGSREYVGIDSSEAMLQKAREFFPDNKFIQADARTVDLEREFTTTVAVSFILHLSREDALAVLANMWKHTASGGIMLFCMETLGNSEERRSSGLLLRNQSIPSIMQDLEVATGLQSGGRVTCLHQKMTYQVIMEISSFLEFPLKMKSCSPISRTSLFKVGTKP